MTNNKIFLSMAALAFVGAMMTGCSSDNLTAETPQSAKTGTVVMKTTISLSENASTRALTEAGVKTFAVGDQIAVIYKNTAGETVKAESAALEATDLIHTQKAKFSVALTDPEPSTAVRYIYPASMAADDVSATTPDNDATIKWTNLATQDGTLTKLASDLDLAVFDGTMTTQAVLPAATLANPLTIGKFTIKNSATDGDITNTITKLTIGDGTNTYTVNPSTLSTIYVAMKPIASSQTIDVTAFDGADKFTKSVTGNALAASNIYDITVNAIKNYFYLKYTSATDSSYVDIPAADVVVWTGTVAPGDVAAGTYVVEGTATCSGTLNLTGNVDLILKNGAKLTVDDGIESSSASLNIYGQGISSSMGQLIVNRTTLNNNAIEVKGLTIHGGKVEASTTNKGSGIHVNDIDFTIYNGVVDATAQNGGYGIYLVNCEKFNIYNGVVDATAQNGGYGIRLFGCDKFNIYNGIVTARGGDATSTTSGGSGIFNVNGSIVINGHAVVKVYGGAGNSHKNGGRAIYLDKNLEISGNADVYAESDKNPSTIFSNNGNITISGGKVETVAVGENPAIPLSAEDITITTGITSVKLTTYHYTERAYNWISLSNSGNLKLGEKTYPKATWSGKTFTDNTTYPDYESSGLDITRSGKVLTLKKHE